MIWVERILSFVIAALALVGVFLQAGLHKGRYRLGTFSYYTNQSNLITGVYQLLIFIGTFTGGAMYDRLTGAGVRYALTLMIWVTHLIYHFLLVPDFKKRNPDFGKEWRTFRNITVHYTVPLLAVLEWVLCADKSVPFYCCFTWLVIPLAYLAFAMVRAQILGPEPKSGVYRYPYVFMDLDKQGPKKWARNVLMALAFYLILGFILFGVSRAFRLPA